MWKHSTPSPPKKNAHKKTKTNEQTPKQKQNNQKHVKAVP